MKKIKISFPADDPQVSVEVDVSAIANAMKEALERLPFKVKFIKSRKEEESGEH